MSRINELEEELSALKEFYRTFPSEFVKSRDDDVLRQVIRDEKMILGFDERGRMACVTGEFEHNEGHHLELGGVLVSPNVDGFNWRGYGLQKVLMGILALRIQIFEPPAGDVFAITKKINKGSVTNIRRAGFEDVINLTNLGIRTADVETENPEKAYFVYQASNNANVAQILEDQLTAKIIDKKNRPIETVLDIPFLKRGYHRDLLQ